jgi:hypothetical protein
MWRDEKCFKNLIGNRTLGRPWRRWEDNIKIYATGVGVYILFIWHRIGADGGSCEHGDGTSG